MDMRRIFRDLGNNGTVPVMSGLKKYYERISALKTVVMSLSGLAPFFGLSESPTHWSSEAAMRGPNYAFV